MEVKQASTQATQKAQQVQQTRRVEQTQRNEARQEQVQASKQQTERVAENKPRPNVNGQGQTVGTRLSVTA